MNPKKNIFYLFLGILLLVMIYNFFIPYLPLQYSDEIKMVMGMSMGRGMGMHGGEEVSNRIYYFYNLIPNLIIISIVLGSFFVLYKWLFHSSGGKCKKCGLPIESNEWKICPRCGHDLQNKGGNRS
jgi:hypothetical protein